MKKNCLKHDGSWGFLQQDIRQNKSKIMLF